jgi:hypothetical protein
MLRLASVQVTCWCMKACTTVRTALPARALLREGGRNQATRHASLSTRYQETSLCCGTFWTLLHRAPNTQMMQCSGSKPMAVPQRCQNNAIHSPTMPRHDVASSRCDAAELQRAGLRPALQPCQFSCHSDMAVTGRCRVMHQSGHWLPMWPSFCRVVFLRWMARYSCAHLLQ